MGNGYGEDVVGRRRARTAKRVLQVLIVVYVLLYAMCYRTTHLRVEPVTGDVYVEGWLDRSRSSPEALAGLGYCAYRLDDAPLGSCLAAVRETPVVGGRGYDRLAQGERIIVASKPRQVDGYLMVDIAPVGAVYLQDMQLCDQPPGVGQRRRCAYVNDVDLHSFRDGNFIPTFVQVVHQRASCVDGTSDLANCQLDYPTGPAFERQIDEFFIGGVEAHKVQLTHTFQAEALGQMRMDEAVAWGVPACGVDVSTVFCHDVSAGGRDVTTVEKLLASVGVGLSSNNAETDHSSRRETFRTSGMKLKVQVRYSNLEGFWSWTGTGQVGYTYVVKQVPAESVWRSKTVTRRQEMRAWVSGERLADFGEYDRLLVWADGIDIHAEVAGHVGHTDLAALLLVLASAAPLLFLANVLVNCLCGSGGAGDDEDEGDATSTAMLSMGSPPDPRDPRSADDAL